MMVKLNAALLLWLGLMLILRRIGMQWHCVPRARLLLQSLRDGAVMASGCLLAVVAVWTIHVAMTPHPAASGSPAGEKDGAFVSLVLAEVAETWRITNKWQEIQMAVLTVLLLVSFGFYSPLSLHRPLTHAQCQWRNAVQHIVECR